MDNKKAPPTSLTGLFIYGKLIFMLLLQHLNQRQPTAPLLLRS